MAFSLSPAVTVREFDLSGYISNTSTTIGAIGGVFSWGPVEDRQFVTSEQDLINQFGKPTSDNFETYFSAANFLAYSDKLYVSRAADDNAYNASCGNGSIANTIIKNETDFTQKKDTLDSNSYFFAKYPGEIGNSLKISVCDSANAFSSSLDGGTANVEIDFTTSSNTATITITGANTDNADSEANTILNTLQIGDIITSGNTSIGKQYLKISSFGDISVAENVASFDVSFSTKYTLPANTTLTTIERKWEYYNSVDLAPATSSYVKNRSGNGDELHVIIVDEDGKFTGTPGTILEIFEGVSRATDARGEQGGSNYYKDVINNSSRYIWVTNDRAGSSSNTAVNMVGVDTLPISLSFSNGSDSASESSISLSALAAAYDQFKSAEDVDVSVIITGKSVGGVHGEGLANYIIDNICEERKDCVVTISPTISDVVNNPFEEVDETIEFRNALGSSSYAFLDGNYKYQYDRYNDVYRWVPLCGDIAGTLAVTEQTRDSWWSNAGTSRGQIKNVVKLAFNPNKAQRDLLYKNSINPVVQQANSGTILFGDKTLLNKNSAFNRMNVRRLFIYLEKAIATAAKDILFEFNDEFTRSQFTNLVKPFLRDVQGRRGIYDSRFQCDENNNTGEIIDNNQLVADIYIKPAKSINEIQLNMVAVRSGIEFEEIVGKF